MESISYPQIQFLRQIQAQNKLLKRDRNQTGMIAEDCIFNH